MSSGCGWCWYCGLLRPAAGSPRGRDGPESCGAVAPRPAASSRLPLVLLPGEDRDTGAVVRPAVGEPVHPEVVVADLVLGLAGQVGVADGGRVDVPGPVALAGVADPGGETHLPQRLCHRGAGAGSHPLHRDVDDAAAVMRAGGGR